jgi:hypothetical protein
MVESHEEAVAKMGAQHDGYRYIYYARLLPSLIVSLSVLLLWG